MKKLSAALVLYFGLACAALAQAPDINQTMLAATTNSSVVIAAGSTFQTVLAAVPINLNTPARHSITIQNNNTTTDNCWVFVGSAAATKPTSILLLPGGSYTRYFPYIPADQIQATCTTTGNTLYVDTQ